MVKFHAVINALEGLHARPASELAKLAGSSGHDVQIGRLEGPKHSAASMLGILSLGLRQGERVEVEVTGDSEEEVAKEIAAFLCNISA